MEKEKTSKKSKAVEVIIEITDEPVDLVGFVRGVLDYEMVKVGRFSGTAVLELPKDKPNDLGVGKQ